MNERRRIQRRYLVYYLRVFDRQADELLGYLINISPKGAMLMSEKPIPVNTQYRLRMVLPAEILQSRHLDFEGLSVWSRKDATSEFFETGFQLLSPSWDGMMVIEQLVDDYGFGDAAPATS
jgi:hypothetical protein